MEAWYTNSENKFNERLQYNWKQQQNLYKEAETKEASTAQEPQNKE